MRVIAGLLTLAIALGTGAPPPAVGEGAAAAAPAGSGRPTPEMRDRFADAVGAMRAGNASSAAREFADPVWASSPIADYASLLLAQSLLASSDAAGARAAATRSVDAAPDGRPMPSALLQAAAVLSGAGDDAGAGELYRRFLDRHGDHAEAPRARFALARSLLSAGRVPEASRAFTDVWLLAPASPAAEDARRQLRVLEDGGVRVPPISPKDRLERAERLLAAGQLDPARAEADALLGPGLPPDLASRALRVTAEAARRAGRLDAATVTVNRALSELPADRRAPWLLELARLQQRKSRDLAVPTLDRLVREYPKSPEAPDALMLKGRLLESANRAAEAEAAYQRLAVDYPESDDAAHAIWRLGWAAWFRGAYADAASRWSRLLTARGGQAYREAAEYWTGRAHEQRGDAAAAARQYGMVLADGVRSYYGLLAGRRSTAGPRSAALPDLPANPREALDGDVRFTRVQWLRAVGLTDFADEEMDDLTRRSLGEPRRLYAASAVYAEETRYHLALRILRRHFQSYARSGGALTRQFWQMFYPLGWRAELTEAAARAAVDPLLVAAVVREESSFYPQARSRVGARGLMQLMPDTARPMAQARRLAFNNGDLLDDPAANLDMGSGYLGGLLREFGDARLAAAAYNAGPGRVREWWAGRRSDDVDVWVEQIPFNETRAYVKRVMLSWEEYRRLYGAASLEDAPATTRSATARP